MESHLNRMRACMREEGMACFCCTDLSNVKWLTAFDNVFDDEPAHLAFVSDDEAVLHTDSRYADAACRAACGGPWKIDASGGFHARWVADKLSRDGRKAPGDGLPALAIEDSMSLAAFRRFEKSFEEKELPPAIETSDFVLKLRAVKDDVEIEAMKAAQAITDAAFEHIVSFMRVGMTEREVQLELEEVMRRLGAEDLAFSSIVASGANGAAPHSIPGEKVLESGDMVVLDFGACKGGYCSDMTRTVCMEYATEEAKRVYEAVRNANEAVERMLRPGVTGAEAHELAECILEHAGYGGKMGHGLDMAGIDIHERPNLSPRNTEPLCAETW
ncbi:MAG: M24 family metallopeptidase [Slackia sp.]